MVPKKEDQKVVVSDVGADSVVGCGIREEGAVACV